PEDRGLLTLDDLLGLVTDISPTTKLFVETKHPVRYGGLVEAKLVAMLARHGLAKPATKQDSQVLAMSFSSQAMRRVREHAPNLPTVLLLERRRRGGLPPWADLPGPAIHMLREEPELAARWRNRDVYCWTVDRPADVQLCARLGVRYIATNSPAATRAVLDG
ncbi:MAG TPA: glycerophosphodiester phosphodiesterase family protein, partial [Pseudonocardiaceae bacterium]|nr:glycerophosphodiester phosphodiesterase family protein [Pseudonocardiaceae bacterium]